MIDDLLPEDGGQVPLGDRHADGIAQALAERAGGGLYARRDEVLGMAGRERTELPEALDLLDGHGLVAEEMEQGIDQHRAVAGRKHEAVAVGPSGIGGVELQEPREQHRCNVGRAHGQAGMAGFRLLDRVHRQRADGVRHAVMLGARDWRGAVATGGRVLRGRRGDGERGFRAGHGGPSGCCFEALARGRGESKNASRRRARHSQEGGQVPVAR